MGGSGKDLNMDGVILFPLVHFTYHDFRCKLRYICHWFWLITSVGVTLYSAILNYVYPSSLEELRQVIERTIDRGATAFKIGEMMDKHGSDDWLEPFLQELGPFIQYVLFWPWSYNISWEPSSWNMSSEPVGPQLPKHLWQTHTNIPIGSKSRTLQTSSSQPIIASTGAHPAPQSPP